MWKSKNFRAFIFFFILTGVLLWPLPLHFTTQVIGPGYGDNLEYVWKLWWVERSLFELGQSPLEVAHIYYPYGYSLAMSAITPFHTYFGAPLTMALGPITTYNFFVFVSFVLAGFFAYLYSERLIGNKLGAVVCGIIFAFLPYHFAKVQAGNLNVIAIQWIPLFFYYLDCYLVELERREIVYLALTYAACTLSSWYYGAMIAILAPVYYAARQKYEKRSLFTRGQWKDTGLFLLIVVGFVLPFLMPYMGLMSQGKSIVPLDNVVFWAASITDYLTPSTLHFAWGNWVVENISPLPVITHEFVITWGFMVTLFAVYGWKGIPQKRRLPWLLLIIVSVILSLGPAFKLFTWAITIPVQGRLTQSLATGLDWLGEHSLAGEKFSIEGGSRLWIPLPALLFRWFVPGFSGLRSWGRFAVFAAFGVAVFAGSGVKRFIENEIGLKPGEKFTYKALAAIVIIIALIFGEIYSGPQKLITPQARKVDLWLAAQSGQSTIIEMPLQVALSGQAMFYSRYHKQFSASGYGTYFPFIFKEKYPALEYFPSDASIDVMRNWGRDVLGARAGIDYILVNELNIPPDDSLWGELIGQSELVEIIVIDGVHVYQIVK